MFLGCLCVREQRVWIRDLDSSSHSVTPWVMREQGVALAKRKQRSAMADTKCVSGSLCGPVAEVIKGSLPDTLVLQGTLGYLQNPKEKPLS